MFNSFIFIYIIFLVELEILLSEDIYIENNRFDLSNKVDFGYDNINYSFLNFQRVDHKIKLINIIIDMDTWFEI